MLARFLAPATAILIIIAAGFAWKVMSQAQEIGAYREQVQRITGKLAAEREQRVAVDASLSRHQAAAQQAERRADALDRRLQEAKRHDPNTQDWAAACGARELPCAYREWLYGAVPADCAPRPTDSGHLPATQPDPAAGRPDDGGGARLVWAGAQKPRSLHSRQSRDRSTATERTGR